MRTAIFGGSFDPVHQGHVDLSQVFVKKLELDRVIIIPAFVSPFKMSKGSAPGEYRLEMCRLAFEDFPNTEVSDIELRREGASYTCDTLTYISQIYPEDKLFLVTGADAFLTIQSWRSPEVIFSKAAICTIPRNDDDIAKLTSHAEYLRTLGAETELLNVSVARVSSTEIRERVRKGLSINGMVPERVEQYILRKGLYLSGNEGDEA
ncbi:MAG: nicotinate (nicotinamide) nucleotide adenylyltransferase [Clostridia bacterium]|nr:nicotinate (nicotinamide) nucleotide adenylyltransferase [Clostridia bacterium]